MSEPCETNGTSDRRTAALDIPVPWSKEPMKIRGLGFIATLQLVATCVMCWVLYDHHIASKELFTAIKYFSCVISYNPDERTEQLRQNCQAVSKI